MVTVVKIFHHYILLHMTTILPDFNPMYYALTHQVQGGKYSRWIVILQEFTLEFVKSSWKKYFVFTELMCDLPHITKESKPIGSFPNQYFFLMCMSNVTVSVTTPNIILSSMKIYITVALIMYCALLKS